MGAGLAIRTPSEPSTKTVCAIRTGNAPDARLMEFISHHLSAALPEHREKFDEYRELCEEMASDNAV